MERRLGDGNGWRATPIPEPSYRATELPSHRATEPPSYRSYRASEQRRLLGVQRSTTTSTEAWRVTEMLALAADELLGHAVGLVVRELLRRVLHEVGRGREQGAADARGRGRAWRSGWRRWPRRRSWASPPPRGAARGSSARRRRARPPCAGSRPCCRSARPRSRSGPTWMFSSGIRSAATDCTASVFDSFFEARRLRFSMLRKSVLPPVLSW